MSTPTKVHEMVSHLKNEFLSVRNRLLTQAGTIAHANKHDGSPVTALDLEIEEKIISSFRDKFPGIAIYGEESGYPAELHDDFWLIDPIDGTASFITNTPTFTNMAVFISNEQAIAAIIYNPSTDCMYTAIKGEGATKNGTKIDLSTVLPKPIALCKGRDVSTLNALLEPVGVVGHVAADGAGNAFAMIAEGEAAAKFSLHSKGHIHDYAPGALLVSESGGVLIPLQNQAYHYDTKNFIACHPSLEKITLQHIKEITALQRATST